MEKNVSVPSLAVCNDTVAFFGVYAPDADFINRTFLISPFYSLQMFPSFLRLFVIEWKVIQDRISADGDTGCEHYSRTTRTIRFFTPIAAAFFIALGAFFFSSNVLGISVR
jgi:hypothetical protein